MDEQETKKGDSNKDSEKKPAKKEVKKKKLP